jgi:hypothetical protein
MREAAVAASRYNSRGDWPDMIIKLYNKTGDAIRYWEAWNTSSEVTIHCGILGENGETRDIKLNRGDDPQKIIGREAKQPKAEGYRRIPSSKLQRLVIQYQVNGVGDVDDLDKREKVEHLMNECLGWKGFGFCDGCDIGSGTMNVFCFVVDAKKATPHVVEELKTNGLSDGAVVAIGGRPKVVWPADYGEKFSI